MPSLIHSLVHPPINLWTRAFTRAHILLHVNSFSCVYVLRNGTIGPHFVLPLDHFAGHGLERGCTLRMLLGFWRFQVVDTVRAKLRWIRVGSRYQSEGVHGGSMLREFIGNTQAGSECAVTRLGSVHGAYVRVFGLVCDAVS